MIYLYAINISDIKYYDKVLSCISKISPERRMRLTKYKFDIDKIRCILGELLLLYILKKHCRIEYDVITFNYNKYGKPMLVNYPEIHFNISHSGPWVLCGVSEKTIGIDIEGGSTVDILLIAERFFSEKEYSYVLDSNNMKDTFYQIWTLKECYIKCIGTGLSTPIASFQFEINQNSISISRTNVQQLNYKFLSIKMCDEYYVGICSTEDELDFWNGEIQQFSLREFMYMQDFEEAFL